MKHFQYPSSFESIKTLVDDANALAEDNARLKRFVDDKLNDHSRSSGSMDASKPAAKSPAKSPAKQGLAKPAAKQGLAKPAAKPGAAKPGAAKPGAKPDAKPSIKLSLSNSVNPWAGAPSVAQVKSKLDGKKKRPVEPEPSDSDDSTPLPKKSKPAVAVAKKTKEVKKEKAFKGMTAYNIYFGERTTALRQESPQMDRSEVAKLTGAEWKTLTPDEKVPYIEKAAERNVEKKATYDAAKANGSVSSLDSCVANDPDDTDDADDDEDDE